MLRSTFESVESRCQKRTNEKKKKRAATRTLVNSSLQHENRETSRRNMCLPLGRSRPSPRARCRQEDFRPPKVRGPETLLVPPYMLPCVLSSLGSSLGRWSEMPVWRHASEVLRWSRNTRERRGGGKGRQERGRKGKERDMECRKRGRNKDSGLDIMLLFFSISVMGARK